MVTLARVACVLMILSGLAGIAAGAESAPGGWWLVIVFGVLLALTFLGGRHDRSTDAAISGTRSLTGLTAAAVTVLVIVPIALVLLLGSA